MGFNFRNVSSIYNKNNPHARACIWRILDDLDSYMYVCNDFFFFKGWGASMLLIPYLYEYEVWGRGGE